MRLGDAMKIKWKAHAHLQELNWRKDKVDAKYDYIADVRVIWVGTLYGFLQKYRKVPKVEVEGWQSEYEVANLQRRHRLRAVWRMWRICISASSIR